MYTQSFLYWQLSNSWIQYRDRLDIHLVCWFRHCKGKIVVGFYKSMYIFYWKIGIIVTYLPYAFSTKILMKRSPMMKQLLKKLSKLLDMVACSGSVLIALFSLTSCSYFLIQMGIVRMLWIRITKNLNWMSNCGLGVRLDHSMS